MKWTNTKNISCKLIVQQSLRKQNETLKVQMKLEKLLKPMTKFKNQKIQLKLFAGGLKIKELFIWKKKSFKCRFMTL